MLQMMLKDLRVNRLRTFLTGLSMLIGIIAMISSVLVGSIGRQALEETNAQLSGRAPTYKVTTTATVPERSDELVGFAESMRTGPGRAVVAGLPQALMVSDRDASAGGLRSLRRVEVLAVTPEYDDVYKLPLVRGRWLSGAAQSTVEVVLNKPAADMFVGASRVFLNTERTLVLTPARVVGTVNDGASQPRIYGALEPLARFAPLLVAGSSLSVVWHPAAPMDPGALRRSVDDAFFNGLAGHVEDVERSDSSGLYAGVIDYLTTALMICAALLLLVSALGLVNIGLASIEQRSHELLIRRALGASRRRIIALVLGSLVILSVVVALLSVLVTAGIVASLPLLLPPDSPVDAPAYPISAAVAAIAAAVLTALLGGALPAVKAARLEPALALR